MKPRSIFFCALILSLLTIFVLAVAVENGDMNSVSMYFVVFLIPVIVLAALDAFYIWMLFKISIRPLKTTLSLLPVVILSLSSLSEALTIGIIDGNLVFATKVGAIAIGLTNLIWLISLERKNTKSQ